MPFDSHLIPCFCVLRVTGHPPGRGTAHQVEEGHLPREAADRPGTGEVAVLIVLQTSK